MLLALIDVTEYEWQISEVVVDFTATYFYVVR